MTQKLMKKVAILSMALFILTSVFAFSLPVLASVDIWGGQYDAINQNIGLGNKDPRVTVANVINVLLGFLGIIAVVIILIGGFKWMTAGGSEDKVGEAKKLITAGIIGLIIILASWSIATFLINTLWTATQ